MLPRFSSMISVTVNVNIISGVYVPDKLYDLSSPNHDVDTPDKISTSMYTRAFYWVCLSMLGTHVASTLTGIQTSRLLPVSLPPGVWDGARQPPWAPASLRTHKMQLEVGFA